jgi:hypothetical protein
MNMPPDCTADDRMPQERLIDLVSGYWRTQVVAVFAQLALADHMRRGSYAVEALAAACEVSVDGLRRLMQAAATLDLVTVDDQGHYQLTALGGTLRSGKLGSLRDYALAMAGPAHWQSWARLADAVRSGAPVIDAALGADLWTHLERNADEGRIFSGAMGDLSQLVALDLAVQYDFSACRRIVDVGGAQGVLLAAALLRAPQAAGVLYDRAAVVSAAREGSALRALQERVSFVAGDFFEQVPAGGDTYLLKQILHDYDDARCLTLLRTIRAVLPSDGRLLVIEMPLDEGDGAATLVDLDMLVLLGGRERRHAEYRQLLAASGFQLGRTLSLRGGFALLEALPG